MFDTLIEILSTSVHHYRKVCYEVMIINKTLTKVVADETC